MLVGRDSILGRYWRCRSARRIAITRRSGWHGLSRYASARAARCPLALEPAAQNDDRDLPGVGISCQPRHDLVAVGLGHPQVDHNRIRLMQSDDAHCGSAIAGGDDLDLPFLQEHSDDISNLGQIIHNDDRWLLAW